ncbi:hypothetical protein [Allokutzneria oryzae]|uniref:Secreted protein n=1 Tax=Allokutzneria oryzae TaxID=1378989 RepID=A0ABV6A4P8_9PSEU
MRTRTFMRVSLVVGGLVASVAIAGGTATAAEAGQGAARGVCSVTAKKDTPIFDADLYAVGTLKKGKSHGSACNSVNVGRYKECGKVGTKLVRLSGTAARYVPLTCVSHTAEV